jgi:flagellar motor protein MotB
MRILLVESDPALGTFLQKSFESAESSFIRGDQETFRLHHHNQGRNVVSLRELGFFASGSTIFQPDAAGTLASFIKVVGRYPVRIRIEGHRDNIPIHNARFDSNWELSTARATEICVRLR